MKILTTMLILALWIPTVSAESFTITDPVSMGFNSGSYITLLPNQTGINFTIFNTTDFPASTLKINLPGSQVLAATDANITLSELKYSIPDDNLSYLLNGTANFNMTASMGTAGLEYQILKNASNDGTTISSGSKIVTVIRAIVGFVSYIIRPFITTAPEETRAITFTDVACLGGSICTSTIHIYSGNTQLGELSSTGTYLLVDKNTTQINITLDESQLSQLNDIEKTIAFGKSTWQVWFGLLLMFGLIVSGYFILKNMFNKKR